MADKRQFTRLRFTEHLSKLLAALSGCIFKDIDNITLVKEINATLNMEK
ncbi:MAG: hypothetical protein ACI9YE_001130 [Psychroserpens sp.]|jgi:hypothetical protein